jgi:hypothetical protein
MENLRRANWRYCRPTAIALLSLAIQIHSPAIRIILPPPLPPLSLPHINTRPNSPLPRPLLTISSSTTIPRFPLCVHRGAPEYRCDCGSTTNFSFFGEQTALLWEIGSGEGDSCKEGEVPRKQRVRREILEKCLRIDELW